MNLYIGYYLRARLEAAHARARLASALAAAAIWRTLYLNARKGAARGTR